MGKKNKKTRWRTLTLNGHESDSEESSSKSSLQTSKGYQHKYSKFPYSSQSSPIRKFQHESSKSTRSNSTTSEHKATFNEDEYTRITTPRQDVLFKKGYLNKPKTYQTQTSTGTSSTANSTSTCTPDHQSADGTEGTDLEYESQFVFPNGFIDRNGIYYINSFEPFPFVVYNAPICYPEYPNTRSKRYSTDSMTESVSPHNEEVGQEVSQNGAGERINNTPVFSQSYMQPAYYFNGVNTLTNGQYTIEEARKFKKRRRKKLSRSKSNHEDESSQDSDDYASSDEVFSQAEATIEHKRCSKALRSSSINHSQSKSHSDLEESSTELKFEEMRQSEASQVNGDQSEAYHQPEILELKAEQNENLRLTNGVLENQPEFSPSLTITNLEGPPQVQESNKLNYTIELVCKDEQTQSEPEDRLEPSMEQNENSESKSSDAQNLLLQSLLKSSEKHTDTLGSPTNSELEHPQNNLNSISDLQDCNDKPKEAPSLTENKSQDPNHVLSNTNITYSLKPDAEEFIPRTFRVPEAFSFDPNVQFLNISPNFIPIPFVNHLGELQQSPFLPPGIPLSFVPPQDPKLLPNFVNIVPNDGFVPKTFDEHSEVEEQDQETSLKSPEQPAESEPVVTQEEEKLKEPEASKQTEPEPVQHKKPLTKNEIDIAKIVYKLEEAAKQQRVHETKQHVYNNRAPNKYNSTKPYPNQRTRFPNRNYQENHYPENRYNQRSRPNSLEKQYDRKYRRPEQNFRRERSKPNFEVDGLTNTAKSETRHENTTPEIVENRLQGEEEPVKIYSRPSTPVRNAQVQQIIERKMEQRNQNTFHKENVGRKQSEPIEIAQKKTEGDQNLVNNVNTRIGESCSMTKDFKLEGTVNYSETLKKRVDVVQNNSKNNSSNNSKSQRYDKHCSEKMEKKFEQKLVQTSTPKLQNAQNQWISVSSRKKRKAKTVSEEQNAIKEPNHEVEEEIQSDDHLFETFDVNLLEDVVPPSKLAETSQVELNAVQEAPVLIKAIEEVLVVIEKEENSSLDVSNNSTIEELLDESAKTIPKVEDAQEIEKTLYANIAELSCITPKDNTVSKPKKKLNEGSISEKKKKKSKKGTQKPITKRIIITDVNLELTQPVPKQDLEAISEPPGHEEKEETSLNIQQDDKSNVNEYQPPIAEIPEQNSTMEDQQINETNEKNLPTEGKNISTEKKNVPTEETQSQNEITEVVNIMTNCVPEDHTTDVKEISKFENINVEEITNKLIKPVLETPSSLPNYQTQTSESDTLTETPEKKIKKKKKKTPKPTLVKIQSASSSNTTLNNLDDSYDFLLENSMLEDSELKTNVEISQELDRIIQKGMYSSLEGKIRALKISATEDGFFQTINYGMLQAQAASEKSSIIKASNFGDMLKNTTQLLKMPKSSEEIDQQNLINIDFSSIKLPDLEPQPSTSKSGIFLDNPEVNQLIKNATNDRIDPGLKTVPQEASLGHTKNDGRKLKNKSKKHFQQPKQMTELSRPEVEIKVGLIEDQPEIKKGEEQNGTIDQESKNLTTSNTFSSLEVEPPMRKSPPKQDSLYPITQAVKDWMTRTRENTPDVEILKSPNTIYKEFYKTETETESESTGDSNTELEDLNNGFKDSKNKLEGSKNGVEDPENKIAHSKNELGDPRPSKSISREKSPLSHQTKKVKSSSKRVAELSHTANDDEITIWSVSPQTSIEEDLLDCWESDLTNDCVEEIELMERETNQITCKNQKPLTNGLPSKKTSENVLIQNGGIKEIKGLVQNGRRVQMDGHIEEGEEAIEIYESSYGNNEDFLKLKAEIEEKQKMNFPKHGNLPYRAICCSIM